MIGLVLVTHGRLAEELRLAMEHVVGPQRAVATVCIGPEDDMERRREDIRGCIAAVDQGDGVVLLTDILGGTPSNLAISLCDRRHVDVIAGVNLPLLVKLAKIRSSEPLSEAVSHAAAAGRKYIAAASDMSAGATAGANGHGAATTPNGTEPAGARPTQEGAAAAAAPQGRAP
jgi:PTS system mannose-specific IIA component